MDDTQTPTNPNPQPTVPTDTMASMSDVAGMTPPMPAPVMPEPTVPAMNPAPMSQPPVAPTDMPGAAPSEGAEDYSYAEDVLNEILDSLDRIEAKLDAMEKKG